MQQLRATTGAGLLDALQAYCDSLVHGCQCCIAPVLLLVNASWPTAGAAASVEGVPSAATPAASLADRCCAGSSCSDRRIVLMFSMVGARELAWAGVRQFRVSVDSWVVEEQGKGNLHLHNIILLTS